MVIRGHMASQDELRLTRLVGIHRAKFIAHDDEIAFSLNDLKDRPGIGHEAR